MCSPMSRSVTCATRADAFPYAIVRYCVLRGHVGPGVVRRADLRYTARLAVQSGGAVTAAVVAHLAPGIAVDAVAVLLPVFGEEVACVEVPAGTRVAGGRAGGQQGARHDDDDEKSSQEHGRPPRCGSTAVRESTGASRVLPPMNRHCRASAGDASSTSRTQRGGSATRTGGSKSHRRGQELVQLHAHHLLQELSFVDDRCMDGACPAPRLVVRKLAVALASIRCDGPDSPSAGGRDSHTDRNSHHR